MKSKQCEAVKTHKLIRIIHIEFSEEPPLYALFFMCAFLLNMPLLAEEKALSANPSAQKRRRFGNKTSALSLSHRYDKKGRPQMNRPFKKRK